MNDIVDSDKILEEAKRLKEDFSTRSKALLKEFHTSIFKTFPEVKGVRWTQYTPYFNDGDSCEFGVHSPSIALKSQVEDVDYDDGFGEHEGKQYGFDSGAPWKAQENSGSVIDRAAYLVGQLHGQMEGVLKDAFDDHKQVTLWDDGTFEVEDYDHD